MTTSKKYWKGLADLNNDPIMDKLEQNEFVDEVPVDEFLSDESLSGQGSSRRDFLKFLGFTTAAATLAACETPLTKVIPQVVKPDNLTPGIAKYYASTVYDGHDFASVLVKTREARPIKINPNKSLSKYGTNARVQASVLSLYDSSRLKNPIKGDKQSEWKKVDEEIKVNLNKIKDNNGNIRILTSSIISPTTQELINAFIKEYSSEESVTVKHIQMDAVSYSGMLDANEDCFGLRHLPTYDFSKAEVIVSFGADFIGNWGPGEYESQYIKGRNPKNGRMSKHYQLESTLTLTGSNADYRTQIKPSEQAGLLSNLYLSIKSGNSNNLDPRLKKIYEDIYGGSKSSIIVCNSNNKEIQTLVNAINYELKNYGTTIFIDKPSYLKKGNDSEVSELIAEMNQNKIDALIVYNVNPSYVLPDQRGFNEGIKKVSDKGITISISNYLDETASRMQYALPDTHNLESWGDAMPAYGLITFMQPTIAPLFRDTDGNKGTRQFQDTLLSWVNYKVNNKPYNNYYDFLMDYNYTDEINPKTWNVKDMHDGFMNIIDQKINYEVNENIINNPENIGISSSSNIEFEVSQKISMGDGSQANNPWLQELPDPLSRACWDNYLTMSASTARELGIKNWNISNGALNGDIVDVTMNDITLERVPVMIQPGQAKGTVALAIGYGRSKAGKCGNYIGVNAYKLSATPNFSEIKTSSANHVKIKKVSGTHEFAAIQLHHTMMGRDQIVKETTLEAYINDPKSGNYSDKYSTHDGMKKASEVTLWDSHDHGTGHFWNLSIDLTKCTGCAACVIACHAENNVPVVGKEEMRKSRDMHWLRIDRYFSSDRTKANAKKDNISAITMYSEMEDPSEKPEVVFQPVMCQHCNHAPCETVCPVAATSHGKEGQNHMAYNRCVGTRYCANNCPYKVRRFNWFQYAENDKFDYNMNDDYGKMVLNPDVVVRSRGVIEKCSMCIQMIQETKLKAKMTGNPVKDQDAHTACSIACSTGAMVFGDVNNDKHEIQDLKKDERAYQLLEHLNVAPSVFYQTKIRNQS